MPNNGIRIYGSTRYDGEYTLYLNQLQHNYVGEITLPIQLEEDYKLLELRQKLPVAIDDGSGNILSGMRGLDVVHAKHIGWGTVYINIFGSHTRYSAIHDSNIVIDFQRLNMSGGAEWSERDRRYWLKSLYMRGTDA